MGIDTRNRVFMIGLDGGTWDVFRPMMDDGLLPHLSRLVREGVSGDLDSTIPPVTAPAWASIQTGVNPGKHAVFEFTQYDHETHRVTLADSRSIRSKTLWELAGEAGKRVVAINIPLTYPPREVKGIVISGLMSPGIKNRLSPKMTFPPAVYDELIQAVSDYQIVVDQSVCYLNGAERFVDELIRVSSGRARAAQHFMRSCEWDLFAVHFQNLDPLQHALWYGIQRDHPAHDPQAYRHAIRYYQALDGIIGEFRETLDEDVTVILLSDHGFGPLNRTFNLGAWLLAEGNLALDSVGLKRAQLGERLIGLLKHMDVFNLRRLLITDRTNTNIKESVRRNIRPNWTPSLAYTPDGPAVYGRLWLSASGGDQPHRQALIDRLIGITDPDTGQPVVKRVHMRQEIYHGPWVESAPHLIIEPCPGYIVASRLGTASQPIFGRMEPGKQDVGTHTRKGIVVVTGARVRAGGSLEGAGILDLAPTVLFLLDLPIPVQMDGHVLMSALAPELAERAAPIFTEAPVLREGEDRYDGYSAAERAEVEEQLRGLGYLE